MSSKLILIALWGRLAACGRLAIGPFFVVAIAQAQTDWPTFGHDLAGKRYSTLKQIDTKNVTTLVRAWTYHMNAGAPPPAAAPAPGSSEANDQSKAVAGAAGEAAADPGAGVTTKFLPW
jgi:hypothetical protein